MEGSGQGPGAAGSAAAGAPGTGPSAAQPGPGRSTDAAASDAPEGSRRPSDGAEPKQQLAEQEQTEQEPPPECRICLFPGGPQDRLVAPCKCAGTVKWAHMACLQQWSRERASLRCEICKTRRVGTLDVWIQGVGVWIQASACMAGCGGRGWWRAAPSAAVQRSECDSRSAKLLRVSRLTPLTTVSSLASSLCCAAVLARCASNSAGQAPPRWCGGFWV